jgi:hypothetical protein
MMPGHETDDEVRAAIDSKGLRNDLLTLSQ